jgi:hypothetical protein
MRSNNTWLFIITLAVLVLVISCMEHGKFKKCGDKGFCNRLRNKSNKSHYVIESTSVEKSSFTAKLVDNKNRYNGDLLLLVNVYENDVFRVRVREWTQDESKLKQRYQVKDVLMDHVKEEAFTQADEKQLQYGK